MTERNEVGKIYERPWGNYKTLSLEKGYRVKILTVNPSGQLSLQKHQHRSEHWVIVAGEPTITIEESVETHHANESFFVPKGTLHRIENFTKKTVVIVEVQVGDYLGEDDIIRYADVYGRDG
ncbi:MAG: phosphomannose isomerase type II C-terminal cupin domain [Pseudomonadota bacterium]|nr:phosphomannose isomerase type II C-terminal cupin domain [Gammaproteobacteria bacterium]MBU1628835.1 phosphomannose isomerase type II C-terminal cupin domain [Gammaproteobacteria bacterium]MBU1926466.1 phosphomannose isomerase type II C-terminal cupin domain [Gammaproteobacteria bacterium]MBU2546422.1 phosphomannose isomerase type II C-terminal cupin domain [Gammaproteobacteria bacterium]